MSDNPIVSLLPGTPGTGENGLQAVVHAANHLEVSNEWGPVGANGFMIADFYRDRVECAFYAWDSRTQGEHEIANLDVAYRTTLQPVT